MATGATLSLDDPNATYGSDATFTRSVVSSDGVAGFGLFAGGLGLVAAFFLPEISTVLLGAAFISFVLGGAWLLLSLISSMVQGFYSLANIPDAIMNWVANTVGNVSDNWKTYAAIAAVVVVVWYLRNRA